MYIFLTHAAHELRDTQNVSNLSAGSIWLMGYRLFNFWKYWFYEICWCECLLLCLYMMQAKQCVLIFLKRRDSWGRYNQKKLIVKNFGGHAYSEPEILNCPSRNWPDIRLNTVPAGYPASISGPVSEKFAGVLVRNESPLIWLPGSYFGLGWNDSRGSM